LSWFDIVKVLSSKTGYAQLDFDNIVEEDEDNCKRRWQESVNKLVQFELDGFRYKEKKETFNYHKGAGVPRQVYNLFLDGDEDGPFIEIIYHGRYDPNVPEEVYCAAIELLESVRKDNRSGEDVPFNETYSFYCSADESSKLIWIIKEGTILAILKWEITGYWNMFDQEAPYVYVSVDNKEYNLVELNKKFREMML